MESADPFDLKRFLIEQEADYKCALGELQRGKKESHWIWYVFPQVAGLGSSTMAQKYAIQSRDEAIAYLAHPILGPRLQECCEALLKHQGQSINKIMGFPDDLKLRSSLTLFAALSPQPSVFHKLLVEFYGGEEDAKTLQFLSDQ